MQKFVKNDIKKYQNRKLVHIQITMNQNDSPNSVYRKIDIWMSVIITVYNLDEDCKMNNPLKDCWGCHFCWKTDDFHTTKFSFKLLKAMMHPIAARVITCASLNGFPITKIINQLKDKKIDLSEHLHPLSGL